MYASQIVGFIHSLVSERDQQSDWHISMSENHRQGVSSFNTPLIDKEDKKEFLIGNALEIRYSCVLKLFLSLVQSQF